MTGFWTSLFLIVTLLAAGCLGASGFSSNFEQFSRVMQRNGVEEGRFLPATVGQLAGLEAELVALQDSIEQQAASNDQQAILLVLETELNLVHMQQFVLEAEEQSRMANLAFPSCTAESNLGKALAALDNAMTQAELAKRNAQSFQANFADHAQQTKWNWTDLQSAADQSIQSVSQTKQQLQRFCP